MSETEILDVLLVEDNPGDAKLVEHHLRKDTPATLADETDLTHVESLDSALETLESTAYDLIFLDLGLPDSSGIETLERVDPVVRATPIVVLTGLDDSETAMAAIQQGAQDYLPKDDIDTGTLWRSLRYAVERERQAQKLRRRTEQLEFFSGILRHDVNNGIEVIKRNAELIESETTGEPADRARTVVDWSGNISELTEKVRGMIHGITRGEQRDLEAIDLASLVAEQVETVEGMDDDATIETAVPFGVSVKADAMLSEVFHNLLTNAVEHNDTELPRVTIDATVEGDTVRVDIADNGPGLPDTDPEQLFAHDPGGHQSDGGGFGLYFVRTMVESYGGSVEARQDEPDGTVFTLELQRA